MSTPTPAAKRYGTRKANAEKHVPAELLPKKRRNANEVRAARAAAVVEAAQAEASQNKILETIAKLQAELEAQRAKGPENVQVAMLTPQNAAAKSNARKKAGLTNAKHTTPSALVQANAMSADASLVSAANVKTPQKHALEKITRARIEALVQNLKAPKTPLGTGRGKENVPPGESAT